MKKTFLYLLLFFASATQAQDAVQIFLENKALRHAQISFELRDLSTNNTIVEYFSQTACTPASVTKAITTAAALETLGADFRFQTKLTIDGTIDQDGTLQGNLCIIGGGDPTLGSRYFSNSDFVPAWMEAIRKAGIKKINGAVYVDTSFYDQNPVPVLWLREDAGNYYAAGVFPLSVFDNSYEIYVTSTASAVTISNKTDYSFRNLLKIGTKDSIYISGEPFSQERTVYGTIRPHQSKTVKGDISNPPQYLAQYFSEKLRENGIAVETDNYPALLTETIVIHTHFSLPLKNIAAMTNTFSINNYAEHLLKYLARDTVRSFSGALQFERNLWASKGIDMSGVFLYDGSGLSPANAITAAFVCDVLSYMQGNDDFRQSLPVAGESGTVAGFLAATPLKRKARVKSGSFRNVQCYAGYISQNNKDYAFCIMVNNFVGERKSVVKSIEQLLVNSLSATDSR